VRALSAYGVIHGLLGNPVAAEQTYAEAWERGKRAGEKRLVAAAVAMRTLQLLFRMPPSWMDEVEATIAMCREEGYDLELAMLLMVTGYYLSFGDSPEAALPCWRASHWSIPSGRPTFSFPTGCEYSPRSVKGT